MEELKVADLIYFALIVISLLGLFSTILSIKNLSSKINISNHVKEIVQKFVFYPEFTDKIKDYPFQVKKLGGEDKPNLKALQLNENLIGKYIFIFQNQYVIYDLNKDKILYIVDIPR